MIENKKISKKLSIAIPTYNRLAYLKECINSILNQTFQDFSIFVFDNASNQPVEEELKKFNDDRIHFIGSDKNISQRENFGRIEKYPFESEYLIIFHDDDLMHPKMLELQTSFLDANRDIIFIVSSFNRVSGKNIHNFRNFSEDKIKYVIYKNSYEFVKAIMSWAKYASYSAMYRMGLYNGGDFNTFSDFTDLVSLAEVSKKGPCAFIDVPLMNYRIHPGQDSKELKKGYEDSAIKTLSFLRENLSPILNKKDKKLLHRYSLNFLIRSYADINKGFFDFLRFMKRCRRQNLIKYSYFRHIDGRGIVSLASIIFKNKRIIPIVRHIKDYLCKIFQ